MNIIKSISRVLAMLERSIIVVLLTVMVLLAFLQVVLRNVFSTGFFWADPFLRHLVLWIGFLGASLATSKEKHINLDIVSRLASPRITNGIRIATNLFASIVTSLLAHAGWTFLVSERGTGDIALSVGRIEVPAWWLQLIIPIGFGLMAFRFLIRTAGHVMECIHPPPGDGKPSMIVPTIEI